MGKFSKIFNHISKEDLKRTHEQKVRVEKLESERIEEERKEIKADFEQLKSNWRKDISESDFTNITKGNKVSQTFQHASGATITLDGALGGKMMVPSQVTIDLGFGEKITVDGPTESDFALTGFTKPLDLKVQKRIADQTKDEINDKLDASEKASGAETAKVEGEGDIWTWTEYMNQMNDLSDKYAKMAEPLEKIKLDYIYNKHEDVPIGIVDKIDAITTALHQAQEALHQKWLAYNKVPDLPLTPADIPVLGNIYSFASGGGEAKYVLDQANEIVDNANKNNDGVIKPGSRGSEQKPINTGLSFSTKKEWFKDIIPQGNIISQIEVKSAASPLPGDDGVMGVKAVHSQISSLSKGVQLDKLGGIDVNDTYAFRPDGYENTRMTRAYANLSGALGGDKEMATKNFATAMDANFLNLVMKTPGRKDPIVYIKTNFSKQELVKMWGKKKYNEVIKKLKSELNVNESTTFSKIKKVTKDT